MSESKIPFSKEVPLWKFLQRSSHGKFEIKRLKESIDVAEIKKLHIAARANHGKLYGLGFNLESKRQFCSKHVYQVYKAIGIEVGQVQTFKELLKDNPTSPCLSFWRTWFFGFIPWSRRTITPASQLIDLKFETIIRRMS